MRTRTITFDTSHVWIDSKLGDYRFFNEDYALAVLLLENICFTNTGTFAAGTKDECRTVCCFVNCNDFFGPGADAEDVENCELETLFWCYENCIDGTGLWCVLKRRMLPWSYKLEKYKAEENSRWQDWDIEDIITIKDGSWMEAFFKKRGVTLCDHQYTHGWADEANARKNAQAASGETAEG